LVGKIEAKQNQVKNLSLFVFFLPPTLKGGKKTVFKTTFILKNLIENLITINILILPFDEADYGQTKSGKKVLTFKKLK